MDIKEIYNLIDEAEWLEKQLQIAVTRQTAFGPTYSAGGHGDSTPLYFNPTASDAAAVLKRSLGRLVMAVKDSPGALSTGVYPFSRPYEYLRSNLARAAGNPDEVTGLMNAVSDGMVAIDIPHARIYLGDCACGEKLYGDPEADEIMCGSCACTYEPAVLRASNQKRGEDLIVTARDAHKYIGEVLGIELTPGRIRNWANRGQLEVRGSVPVPGARQEASLYRLGDVIAVAREMSARNGDKSVRT